MFTKAADLAALITERLVRDRELLARQWRESRPVHHAVIDDLLPADDVRELAAAMPDPSKLMLKRSLRERKRVGVRVDDYHPAVGAHLFAFQDSRVIDAVVAITGLAGSEADPTLYASGISVMSRGDFLNPHLDNSHDGNQKNYRVLNLLFYVSPDWAPENGGNLELWDETISAPATIHSRFNRLVLMETNPRSWHSVSRVKVEAPRLCVSNYYFSPQSPIGEPYRNVTSFRGRPEEPLKRIVLRLDAAVLNAAGRMMPWLLTRNPHRRQKS